MPCLSPVPALMHPSGRVTVKHRRGDYSQHGFPGEIELACKACEGCRVARQVDWAIRGAHEMVTNTRRTRHGPVINGCFITLTYDDENLGDPDLELADWQNFMKKIRRNYGGKVRYLACGEYGPKYLRKHLHACLFGVDFHGDRERCIDPQRPDSVDWQSKTLSEMWQNKGRATLGALSYATVAYTAGYILEKQGDQVGIARNGRRVPLHTTPESSLVPEWNTMSKKPGLGTDWFRKYWSDVYPKDEVQLNGNSYRPPKFYDALLKKEYPHIYAEVIEARRLHTRERGLSTPYDIDARRKIHAARKRDKKPRKDI